MARRHKEPNLRRFKRFYAAGGYVGSPNSKRNVDDDFALWGSQYLAAGGQVSDLVNLEQMLAPFVQKARGGPVDDLPALWRSQYV
jgi:hypothetical protein